MIRRGKITKIFSYFGGFFSNTAQTPKILLRSMLLKRVGRKSESFLKPYVNLVDIR